MSGARAGSIVSPARERDGVDVGVEREGRDVYLSLRSSTGRGARVTLRLARPALQALLATLLLAASSEEAPDHYEMRLRGALDART